MSQENVEIVRRVFAAVARGDADAVKALYHPDVEWDATRSAWAAALGTKGPYRGHEGLREWYRDWREVLAEVEEHCDELIDAGETVVSMVTQRARGLASGAAVEMRGQGGVWTIRDGQVVRVVWFRSRQEALAAAGLAE